jgi:hypothetical protein
MALEINFIGTHTLSDLTKASLLHMKKSKTAKFIIVLLILVAFIGTTLLAIARDFSMLIAFIIMLTGIIFVNFGLPRVMAARAYRINSMHSQRIEGEITDEKINIRRESSQTSLKWSQIHKHKLSPDIALLYLSPYEYGFLCRTLFKSDQDWEEFLSLIRRHTSPARTRAGQTIELLSTIFMTALIIWYLVDGFFLH